MNRTSTRVMILLVFALVGMSVLLVGSAAANEPVDLDPDTDLAGEGTVDAPYEISNASELQAMEGNLSANYTLIKDVNASETAEWNEDGGEYKGFDPIGEDYPNTFTGTFDGANHTISDLYIKRGKYVGLFGYIDSDATVENVGLENIDITGSDFAVGGLVGRNEGEVTQSYASGDVTGNNYVGGIVGFNRGIVKKSYATGVVDGTEWVGGLLGYNDRDVTKSYATGHVDGDIDVGGLVGYNANEATITESYATGNVTSSGDRVGGLVGYNGITRTEVNGYWDKNRTGQDSSDGSSSDNGLSTEEMQGNWSEGNMTGFDFTNTWSTVAGDYPDLQTNTRTTSTPHFSAPDDAEQARILDEMKEDADGNKLVTSDKTLQAINHSSTSRSDDYRLVVDIDASGTKDWNDGEGFKPIGEFTGSLDGESHSISSLYINRSSRNTALFERVNGAVITNLAIENANITGGNSNTAGIAGFFNSDSTVSNVSVTGTFRGNSGVAGVTGYSKGDRFENVSANVTVHAEALWAGGLIAQLDGGHLEDVTAEVRINSTSDEVGGIVGSASRGTIRNASATGTVVGNEDVGGIAGRLFESELRASSSTVDVSGELQTGGLVGEISEASIKSGSARGPVNGTEGVGGLVGVSESGSITNSSAHGSVDGTEAVGGLVGITEDAFNANTNAVVVGSFATGTVDEDGSASNSGGLVGRNDRGDVEDAYWDTESTGQDLSAGGATGLTTAQMTGLNASKNMGGLNFTTTWTELDGYPIHRFAVSDLSVDLADDDLNEGETTEATVAVTAYGQRGYWANTTADYDSSDTSVATVDRGTVTTTNDGSTTITADRAGVDDTALLSVQRVPASRSSGGSGGSGSTPITDDGDRDVVNIEPNDDGSVSATTRTTANQPTRVDLGDSVGDEESGTRYSRVDLTFGEDTEVTFSARSTSRDDLPTGTPTLGGDNGGDAGASDRAISYVEFTVSSGGVDASDRVGSATIEFDVSTDTLAERNLDADDIALNRYDDEAGEWTELDTEVVSEGDQEVTYESTTPGFSVFAVGERAADEPTESTITDTESATESTSTDTESTELPEMEDETPGFGLLAAVVALLAVALLIARRE